MKMKSIVLCGALVACSVVAARAQDATTVQPPVEQPVAIAQKAVALDSAGREALTASLLTTTLQGTPEAPVKNVRFVIENRGASFYTYVSGTVTFYKEGGIRCGEGLFVLNALAPGESAEVDTPGLRLECAPASWRIVANNLMTRSSGAAQVVAPPEPPTAPQPVQPPPAPASPSPLYLTVDGQQYQVPVNSALEIPVRKRRIKITLSDQP